MPRSRTPDLWLLMLPCRLAACALATNREVRGSRLASTALALSSEVQWRAAVLRQPARRGATAAASLPHLRAHFSSSPPLPLSFAARFARLQQCVGLVKAIAAVYATSHGPDEPPLLFFDPPEPQVSLLLIASDCF